MREIIWDHAHRITHFGKIGFGHICQIGIVSDYFWTAYLVDDATFFSANCEKYPKTQPGRSGVRAEVIQIGFLARRLLNQN